MVCAREALKDVLATPAAERFDPVRTALDLNERLCRLWHANAHRQVVLQRTGIDPFDVVLVDPQLGKKFICGAFRGCVSALPACEASSQGQDGDRA